MSESNELTFKELKELKNIYLAKKQGEALERTSNPKNHDEALSLGYYAAPTNLALNTIDLFEKIINKLSGCTGNEMKEFTEGIARASGSREFIRGEKTLETVGNLGQYIPMQKGNIPTPQSVDLNQ